MASSITMLVILVALKVSLHLSGEGANAFDTVTDGKSSMFVFFVSLFVSLLFCQARLIPNFDSIYTLLEVFISVITSVGFNLTLDWEDFEHVSRENFYKKEYSHFKTLSEPI